MIIDRHACGENPRRVYGNSRMDSIWAFRVVYDKAQQVKSYREKIESSDRSGLGDFPEKLQYEALVDVLRGRVKFNVHCYETVDLDDIIRVSYSLSIQHAIIHLDPM